MKTNNQSQDIKEQIIKLKIAYLEAYTAWLNLDYIGKQMYPKPEWIDFKYKGKVIKL